ncbi:hypothetical protein QJS10_CPA06g01042 [Acorus calamus]|uniref:Bowman-Birk serine protease inhibitors family domain-containing protein n=1 Tax=Acorus calamus TaxID=4465 RepID=A0AAV9EQV7_ACOCL|nr:hypothetical protein QJS10_CPA06g01042 [Acorus calamus]
MASSSSPIALLLVVLMFSVVSQVPSSTAAIDILDRFMMFDDEGIMKAAVGVKRPDGPACCDTCLCTKSEPPLCRCFDVKSDCTESWGPCFCTKSIPPQCISTGVKDNCGHPCPGYA